MLVNSVAYKDGRKIADVKREEIHSYLERDDCILWMAVRDPEPHELDELEKEFGLHPLAIEDARHGHQRAMSYISKHSRLGYVRNAVQERTRFSHKCVSLPGMLRI